MPAQSEDEIARVGAAAGVVWRTLHGTGGMTIAKLTESSGLPRDIALLGLGWLAREGKLQFRAQGRTRLVALTDAETRLTSDRNGAADQ